MLAQAYGAREAIPLSAFSWVLRRGPDTALARKSFNVSFALLCRLFDRRQRLDAAQRLFLLGNSILVLLALGSVRPRRVSRGAWIVLVRRRGAGGPINAPAIAPVAKRDGGRAWRLAGRIVPASSRILGSAARRLASLAASSSHPRSPCAFMFRRGRFRRRCCAKSAYDAYKNQNGGRPAMILLPFRWAAPPTTRSGCSRQKISAPPSISRAICGTARGRWPCRMALLNRTICRRWRTQTGLASPKSRPGPGLVNFRAHYGRRDFAGWPAGADGSDRFAENEKPCWKKWPRACVLAELPERQRIRAVSALFPREFHLFAVPAAAAIQPDARWDNF